MTDQGTTIPIAVVIELARVARYAQCSVCLKSYDVDPTGYCLLADHIEGYEAVRAFDEAMKVRSNE